MGCYVLFFALILPLICWGAWAEPGHPHRTPHFVFVDPAAHALHPPAETRNNWATAPSVHQQHQRMAALAVVPLRFDATCHLRAAPLVNGRATPTLLLFSILLLILLAERTPRRLERLGFVSWVRPLFPQAYVCAVLLPPPRLSR
ncbi:MAG: hypothetical protein DYG89_41700 [Caldilinea sp. CFX5]|nr:hypothetical protein [Caldilinea sp. CFX5]